MELCAKLIFTIWSNAWFECGSFTEIGNTIHRKLIKKVAKKGTLSKAINLYRACDIFGIFFYSSKKYGKTAANAQSNRVNYWIREWAASHIYFIQISFLIRWAFRCLNIFLRFLRRRKKTRINITIWQGFFGLLRQ